MVVNACLAKGSTAMGKKQTIVKNINALQSFGSMDILCVDTTGTLTGDEVLLEYYLDILCLLYTSPICSVCDMILRIVSDLLFSHRSCIPVIGILIS